MKKAARPTLIAKESQDLKTAVGVFQGGNTCVNCEVMVFIVHILWGDMNSDLLDRRFVAMC